MKLSLERLKFLAANPSEVYAKETQAMARMCINAHPDSFMEGFEPSDWPEKHDVTVDLEPMSVKERQEALRDAAAVLKTLDNPEAYKLAGVVSGKAQNKKGEAPGL